MKRSKYSSIPFSYVALGDSLANGVGAIGYGYPNQLLTKIQQKRPAELHLFAKNGQTSSQLLERWPTYAQTVATADLVTINIGGNDLRLAWRLYGHRLLPRKLLHKKMDTTLTTLANNCNVLADNLVKTMPRKSRVVMIDLYNPYQEKHPETNFFIERANHQFKVICANHNFTLIQAEKMIKDYHIQSGTPLASDNLHLNHAGYHLLAQAIYLQLFPDTIWHKAFRTLMSAFSR